MLTALADDLLADRIGRPASEVLALHGWMRSGADFAPVVAGEDALAVHFPGFGITPEPPAVWGSTEYADQLAGALAGTGPYTVVGHSFGGRVAVRLAVRHPELVRSLVLTGAPLVRATPPPTPALRLRLAKRLVGWHLVPESVVERIRRNAGSDDYRALQGRMREIFVRVVNEDYREDLARISVPTTFVWGELDDQAPLAGARLAASLVPGAGLEVVPSGGHLLTGPVARAVAAALAAHLDTDRGSTA
ncbi:alpha/beta fold hydrolase [Actinotalea sp. M2MS4P-6]|uniref:alpha/beta fold hydrolase n=1 Tax=Actinotalea sp. M2MS4P-6 TaxID=2983762 RepID=UPI00296256B3|nr:alpha/beta fold hydrolase [Actinotalea sp. M2MS4P-6]